MKKLFIVLLVAFLLVQPEAEAAQLDRFFDNNDSSQPSQIIWKLSGMGRLSGDIIFAPNGNLLLPLGKKVACVNPAGKVLWEIKSRASLGSLMPTANGSIFAACGAGVQETKLNGAAGWDFSVFADAKGLKSPLLASGPANILYLPLPDALYAVDTVGHYAWMLSPWESSDGKASKVVVPRTFMACASDDDAFYVVYGEKSGKYKLAAINSRGEYLWKYWLGNINSAYLLPDGNGRLYASVNFKKSSGGQSKSKLNSAKIYCFNNKNGSSPLWENSIKTSNELTAPALSADTVYATGSNKVWAFEAANGKSIWETPLLEVVSPPATGRDGRRIYAGSSENKLYALNNSGRMAWHRDLDSAVIRAPLAGPDDFIYVATQKGSIYKIIDNYNGS